MLAHIYYFLCLTAINSSNFAKTQQQIKSLIRLRYDSEHIVQSGQGFTFWTKQNTGLLIGRVIAQILELTICQLARCPTLKF